MFRYMTLQITRLEITYLASFQIPSIQYFSRNLAYYPAGKDSSCSSVTSFDIISYFDGKKKNSISEFFGVFTIKQFCFHMQ